MTIPLLAPHVAAVQVMLAAGLPATVEKYDGDVPTTPGQTYTVLYPDAGSVERSSLLVASDHFAVVMQLTCVGTTALQARATLDAARGVLLDQVPTVTGRVCWPITEQDGTPPIAKDDPARDPLLNRARFYFTPRFRIASVAA